MWSNKPGMNVSSNIVVLSLSILILSISACGGLTRSDKPATKTWWLKPYAAEAQKLSSEPVPRHAA